MFQVAFGGPSSQTNSMCQAFSGFQGCFFCWYPASFDQRTFSGLKPESAIKSGQCMFWVSLNLDPTIFFTSSDAELGYALHLADADGVEKDVPHLHWKGLGGVEVGWTGWLIILGILLSTCQWSRWRKSRESGCFRILKLLFLCNGNWLFQSSGLWIGLPRELSPDWSLWSP